MTGRVSAGADRRLAERLGEVVGELERRRARGTSRRRAAHLGRGGINNNDAPSRHEDQAARAARRRGTSPRSPRGRALFGLGVVHILDDADERRSRCRRELGGGVAAAPSPKAVSSSADRQQHLARRVEVAAATAAAA